MLITLLNKLSDLQGKRKRKGNHNPSQNIRLQQKRLHNNNNDGRPAAAATAMPSSSISDEWQMVVPISADEDFQVVIPSEEQRDAGVASQQQQEQQQRRLLEQWNAHQQQRRSQLDQSIHATFRELLEEKPDLMEEKAIQRAMELSLLDFALVARTPQPNDETTSQKSSTARPPHEILGIPPTATVSQIKAAYRELAKIHHPDKGGSASTFAEIAKAYRSLLTESLHGGSSSNHHRASFEDESVMAVKSTAHWDQELQDHRRLVQDLFTAAGMDLEQCVAKQSRALDLLSLTYKDAGATNRNEHNEPIANSCFYLSLATSYLWGIGALSYQDNDMDSDPSLLLLLQETALQLKRTIEAAVVKAHPEWCLQGKVGEEVQAFSDFLVYTLESPTLLSDWAVVVFDTTSGFVDVYQGKHYDHLPSNTITVQYLPGHYQALIPSTETAQRPTLHNILQALDAHGVFYVVTDGNS